MATVPLATYLLKRIHQLGIGHIQGRRLFSRNVGNIADPAIGVPGDMNLRFLDYIEEMPEIQWGT